MKKVNDRKKTNEQKKTQLSEFIKTNILKKTKILSIIGLVLFVILVSTFSMSDIDISPELDVVEKTSLLSDLKERIIILLLILLAGWVPYFYIPAIAFGAYIFMLSGDFALSMISNGKIVTLILNIIPILLDIVTISIISAIGIYMSCCSTKKHRYTQRTSFSFLDVKIQLYQMTKKQDKYEVAVAKKQERIDKMKENDVKIDYTNILRIVPAIIIVNLLACIIQHFIN